MSGGKTVAQLLPRRRPGCPSCRWTSCATGSAATGDLVMLDVREKDAFDAGHIPGAQHLPRGQLELRVNTELPDPTVRILTCCEFGKISTLAAATLRELGYHAGRRARWRHEGLARAGLSAGSERNARGMTGAIRCGTRRVA